MINLTDKSGVQTGWRIPLRMVLLLMAVLSLPVSAQQNSGSEMETVRKNLEKIIPERMEISTVEQTAMEGVYHVRAGNEHLYVYSSGEFVMLGEVFDTNRRVSWTRERKDQERQVAIKELDAMPESRMIIMGDPQGERHITVFTDTDCGWCQKFHRDIPALKEAGLKVRYMMWPRAGLKSASYDEAVSVWCAEDQGDAMTRAKARQEIEKKVCENPVAEHYRLGFKLGVKGTPYIMLDDGRVLGGYVPPEKLLAEAGLNP
jgi:thiol:disulfide interchange protein DsbC